MLLQLSYLGFRHLPLFLGCFLLAVGSSGGDDRCLSLFLGLGFLSCDHFISLPSLGLARLLSFEFP